MAQLDTNWNGSVISATLREQDLIPAFEGVLDIAGVEYDRPASVDKLLLGQSLTDEETEEVAFYLNETLFDLLNEIYARRNLLRADPGDGSDFGFGRRKRMKTTPRNQTIAAQQQAPRQT